MLGIIIQLAASWLIVWLFQKKGLGVLGFRPTHNRISGFFLFLLLAAACCSAGFLLRMYLGERWEVNPVFTAKLLAEGLWWNIKSVLFEEFLFRGVILYILIKRVGAIAAIILSAVAFGIYHWFSYGILGNVGQMVIIFLVTGIMGLLLAWAYYKTSSLYVPIAIHLGWNFTNIFIFSNGNIGKGLFVLQQQTPVTVSYFTYFIIVWLPFLVLLGLSYILLRRRFGNSSETMANNPKATS
jgi:hypothetical protein